MKGGARRHHIAGSLHQFNWSSPSIESTQLVVSIISTQSVSPQPVPIAPTQLCPPPNQKSQQQKNSPSSINLINSLPIPQIPLHRIPQLSSFITRPTAIHHNDDIFQPTRNVFVPVPTEAEVDRLGVGAAVPKKIY